MSKDLFEVHRVNALRGTALASQVLTDLVELDDIRAHTLLLQKGLGCFAVRAIGLAEDGCGRGFVVSEAGLAEAGEGHSYRRRCRR